MLLEHVVEGSKGQTRPAVSRLPHNVILSCEVGRQRQASLLFLSEDVVDDLECGFVGTDVVEGEDRVDYLPPFVVISRQRRKVKPTSQARRDILCVVGALMEEEIAIRLHLFLSLVKNGIELVRSHVVYYLEVL